MNRLYFLIPLFFLTFTLFGADIVSLENNWTKKTKISETTKIAFVSFSSNAAANCETTDFPDEIDTIQFIRFKKSFLVRWFATVQNFLLVPKNWDAITSVYEAEPPRYETAVRFQANDQEFSLDEILSVENFLLVHSYLPHSVLTEIAPAIKFLLQKDIFDSIDESNSLSASLNPSSLESDGEQGLGSDYEESENELEK